MKETGEPINCLIPNATKVQYVTGKYSHKKFWNQTPSELAQTANTSGANATRLARWRIWAQPIDQSSSVGDLVGWIQIDYAVRLSNKNQLVAS